MSSRNSFQRISITSMVGVLALFCTPTSANAVDNGSLHYEDYLASPSEAQVSASKVPQIAKSPDKQVEPLLTPVSAPQVQFAAVGVSIPKVKLAQNQVATPTFVPLPGTANKTPETVALQAKAATLYNNYCSYYVQSTANPLPPARGQSWSVARTSYTKGWEIAQASRDGWDSLTTTTSASIKFWFSVKMSSAWPYGSRITGYIQPSYRGTFALSGKISPWLSPASASASWNSTYGWTIGSQSFMNPFASASDSVNGTEKIRSYYWDTPTTQAYTSDVGVQPGVIHTLGFDTNVTANATATYGAGAFAMIDSGGQNLDVPKADNKGHVSTDDDNWITINYRSPIPGKVVC